MMMLVAGYEGWLLKQQVDWRQLESCYQLRWGLFGLCLDSCRDG
jgi:hypothetical protein